MKRLHAIIHGKVQGVSFRYYTQQRARVIGAVGWVRNLEDRTVEVTAEGTDDQLNQLLDFLHHGPPDAHVTKVDVNWAHATGEFKGFEIH